MFEGLIKQMKKLQETSVSVPVNTDEEGYLDRECPSKECLFQFKIHEDDWKNICKDEAIYCPLCGHSAPSTSWWTKEQLEAAKEQALGVVKAAINQGLADGARSFNRKMNGGFIKMTMSVSGRPKYYNIIPVSAQEAMKLKIQCGECFTRFAVVGSAFFCPACMHNSIDRTFDDSMKKVATKIDNIPAVMKALEQVSGRDEATLTCRSLLETGISDCVVAFQKMMESLYLKKSGKAKVQANTFQRIDDGSKLWQELCGESYESWIGADRLKTMILLFQKRHILAHGEGFVDDKYVQKTGDDRYKVGQRVVIRDSDVLELLDCVKTIVAHARKVQARNEEVL